MCVREKERGWGEMFNQGVNGRDCGSEMEIVYRRECTRGSQQIVLLVILDTGY